MGVLFGYFVVAPLTINFFATFYASKEIVNIPTIDSYVSIIKMSVIASGLMFELPVIIYFLTKLGLITPAFLKKHRRYAVVIILILSAIVTPPDIASQIIVAIPILLLYEVSILISIVVAKKEKINEQSS